MLGRDLPTTGYNRQLHSNVKEKRRITVENSFPLLVVTTDNFTAMWKKNTRKNSWRLFSTPSSYNRQTSQQCERKTKKNSWKFFSIPSSYNRQLNCNEKKNKNSWKLSSIPGRYNRQLYSNEKEGIKTVENSFPFLVVTTDNFTAMRKKQMKILFHS